MAAQIVLSTRTLNCSHHFKTILESSGSNTVVQFQALDVHMVTHYKADFIINPATRVQGKTSLSGDRIDLLIKSIFNLVSI